MATIRISQTRGFKRIASTPERFSAATTRIMNRGKGGHFEIPLHIIEDLACRFIINLPESEQSNLIRLFFHIEFAHWFYLDCVMGAGDSKLLRCGLQSFAAQMLQSIPSLNQHVPHVEKLLDDYKTYKNTVPTFGAILVSEDLQFCLMVQSFNTKSSWGFPKGKINEQETPERCAAREVFEETGYDISGLISPDDFLDAYINKQYIRLYVIPNVPFGTKFAPRTRNEIDFCIWCPIDALPSSYNDAMTRTKLHRKSASFYMIVPFVKRLKLRVAELRNGGKELAEPPTKVKPKKVFRHQKQISDTIKSSTIQPNAVQIESSDEERAVIIEKRQKEIGEPPVLQFGKVRLLRRDNSTDARQFFKQLTDSAGNPKEPAPNNEAEATQLENRAQETRMEQQERLFGDSLHPWLNFSFGRNFLANLFS